MRIPGCQSESFHSVNPENQKNQKKFLGGCDVRGDSAPVRLDEDAPVDPRHKIADLVKGLVAIGIDRALVEKVWAKLATECDGDHEKVSEKFRTRFSALLAKADA